MTNKELLEIRTLPVDMFTSDDGYKVQGYVNVTGSVSEILTNPDTGKQFRETILPHVFADALIQAPRVDFLYQHDKMKILSTTENNSLSLTEDSQGLFMRATIADTSWGRDTHSLIKSGIICGMSFGMVVDDSSWTLSDDGLPLRIIKSIRLFEVSAVRNPAYRSSTIETRGIEQVMNIEIPEEIEKREDNMAEPEKKDVVETPKDDKKDVKKDEETRQDAPKAPVEPTKKAEKRDDDVIDDDEEVRANEAPKSSLESDVKELISTVKSLISSLGSKTEKREDVIDDEDDDREIRATEVKKDEKKADDKEKTPAVPAKKDAEKEDEKSTKEADTKDADKKPKFGKEEKRELVDFFGEFEKREV